MAGAGRKRGPRTWAGTRCPPWSARRGAPGGVPARQGQYPVEGRGPGGRRERLPEHLHLPCLRGQRPKTRLHLGHHGRIRLEVPPSLAPVPTQDVLDPADEDARVAALDAYLLARLPPPDPRAERATELAELVRTDRSLLRVDALARAGGLSVRSLQRLFSTCVGVGPKWVILRHRVHEALRRAGNDPEPDWAAIAADLGYSDQAHLVRDFTATVGVPPAAFAQR